MIERHWIELQPIANQRIKVSFGFEGFNNKSMSHSCRAYGLRDEIHLRLKILTSMLSML